MTTALFLLRCVKLNLTMADLDVLTVGMIMDMFVEQSNDDYDWEQIATQQDIDNF